MRTFNRYGDTWTDGVYTIQITDTDHSYWASLMGPTRGARDAAAIDAQNLADMIEAGHDDTATAHEEDSDALADVTRILDEIGAPRVTYEGMGPARPAERLRAMLDQPADEDQKHDDDAFPSAELADVIALLDELDAPREQDGRTLTTANRLRLYLDQRAEQVRTAAEDDAKEWASDAYTQRGLVLAIAELGHALARGAR